MERYNRVFFVLISVLLAVALFFALTLVDFRATMYAIFPDGAIEIPAVSEDFEVVEGKYKFSNSSGVIVSTEPVIHCEWKPDHLDDGWKSCEAVFEIENLGKNRPKIYSPKINFDFESDKVRNVKISYSDDYEIAEEDYVEGVGVTLEAANEANIANDVRYGFGITGRAIIEEDYFEKGVARLAKPIKGSLMKRKFEDFRNLTFGEVEQEQIAKKVEVDEEKIEYGADEKDYSESGDDNEIISEFVQGEILNESLMDSAAEEVVQIEEGAKQNLSQQDEVEVALEEEDKVEVVGVLEEQILVDEVLEEQNESLNGFEGTISGMVISGEAEEGNEIYINTRRPFAVKIEFEIPKYDSNQFNFEILEGEFAARIDPEVSDCGVLDSAGVYTLSENVEATGTCFEITADNVTLDCDGRQIIYASESSGYGVYSEADGTRIVNCEIIKSNLSSLWAYSVYFSGVENGEVSGNMITMAGELGTVEVGVYLDSSSDNSVYENTLDINGSSSSGFYLISSFKNLFYSNNLNLVSEYEGYGFYSDSESSENNLSENTLLVSGGNIYAGIFSEVSDFNILGNGIEVSGFAGHGFYLIDSSGFNFNSNFILHSAGEGECIRVDEESSNIILQSNNITSIEDNVQVIVAVGGEFLNVSGNNLSSYGSQAHTIYFSTTTDSEVSANNIFAQGSNSNGLFSDENSDFNIIKNNFVVVEGNGANGFFLSRPDNNLIEDNTIEIFGESSIGINVTYGDAMNISGNSINTYGGNSYGLVLIGNDFLIASNNISTQAVGAHGLVFLGDSEQNEINNNTISTMEESAYGISLTGIFSSDFHNNIIQTHGIGSYAVHVFDCYFNNFLNNSLITHQSDAHVAYLSSSYQNMFEKNVLNSSGTNANGIYVTDWSNSSSLVENQINIFGSSSSGVYLSGAVDTYSYGNEIRLVGSEIGKGIYLGPESFYNSFSHDKISTFGDYGDGVFLEGAVSNNFSSLVINTSGIDADGLQFISSTVSNRFENLVINLGEVSAKAIYVSEGNHDFGFYDCDLVSSSESYDFYAQDTVEGDWNFTNMTFDSVYLDSGVMGRLNVGWYLDIYVQDTNGNALSAAEIVIRNLSGEISASSNTNSDGHARIELLEYYQDALDVVYFQNYSVNVSLSDGRSGNHSVDMNTNRELEFIFSATGYSVGGGRSKKIEDVSCEAEWKCSAWTECLKGLQRRECINENAGCIGGKRKPIEARSCGANKRDNLFDIGLELIEEVVYPGRDLVASITLINMGRPGLTDTTIYYGIFDSNREVVFEETEQVTLETQVEYIKEFETQSYEEGDYSLMVDLSYEDQQAPAVSETRFVVSRAFFSPGSPGSKIFAIGIILLVVAVSLIALRRNVRKSDLSSVNISKLDEAVSQEKLSDILPS